MVAIRYAVRLGDIDALEITKLDILDHLDSIKVATAYSVNGTVTDEFPNRIDLPLIPSYRTLPGWRTPTSDCRRPEELPERTREYLQFIADESGCPIAMVSVGKERSAAISFDPWLKPRSTSPERSFHG
jgi:adenylosuccinate synthase